MIGIRKTDAPVGVNQAGVEIRTVEAGSMYVGFEHWPVGHVEGLFDGLPNAECRAEHWGYTIRGQWRVKTPLGRQTVEAGQAYHLPRGHALIEVLEPADIVEFTPINDPYLEETVHAFQRNLRRVAAALRPTP